MFNIDHAPQFSRTVDVQVPSDGGFSTQTFTARFEAIPDDEHDTFDTTTAEGIRALLRRVVVDLSDVADKTGAMMAYSDTLRDRMLGYSYIRLALLDTYMKAMVGIKAGN